MPPGIVMEKIFPFLSQRNLYVVFSHKESQMNLTNVLTLLRAHINACNNCLFGVKNRSKLLLTFYCG